MKRFATLSSGPCLAAIVLGTTVACDRDGSPDPRAHSVPFKLTASRGDFLFEWVSADGEFHTGTRLEEVPRALRQKVRVEPLSLPPERRAPPDLIYLADLRKAGRGGVYPVQVVPRESFEALSRTLVAPLPPLRPRQGTPEAEAGPVPEGAVVIYGASWCGACRQAAEYLRRKGVPFVEKDIERDPAARAEMDAKCRAAGIRPSGIPVIDVRGRIVQGFSPGQLGRLLASG